MNTIITTTSLPLMISSGATLSIFLSILIIITVSELVSLFVFSGVAHKRYREVLVKKYIAEGSWHSYDILSNLGFGYISKPVFSLFFKWYIDDYGLIPRWSEESKMLDAAHKAYLDRNFTKK